ncbi:MAG: translation initiation factor IF-2 N-terminal domain-containing protein, partial [Planctomycetota bacterium]|nr:translation initiation factor IF-2 N-terminal domain-containing protein [Planctomycetota bacterium]
MPIRIYALAKELKIDSKELVEVCNRAGVTGKGSALASVTDEEIAKVRAYLAGGGSRPAPPANDVPVRPTTSPSGDRSSTPRILSSGPPANVKRPTTGAPAGTSGTAESDQSIPTKPATSPQADETQPVAARTGPLARRTGVGSGAGTTSTAPSQSRPSDPPSNPVSPLDRPSSMRATPSRPKTDTPSVGLTRDDYIAPGGTARKPRVLDVKRVATDGGKSKPAARKDEKEVKRGPVVKLAAMPDVKSPPISVKKEIVPQKPIMSLPPEALRSARTGGDTAPLREFTRQHEKKREATRKGSSPADVPVEAKPERGKERRKVKEPIVAGHDGLAGMASA